MVMACFAYVWAALRVLFSIQVAEVLKLVILLHMFENGFALPMGGFKIPVFGALFSDLDFATYVMDLCVYFLLAFGTYAFSFAYSSHPMIPSTMSASGSSIIDIVTNRSYLRISTMVEAETNKRIAE